MNRSDENTDREQCKTLVLIVFTLEFTESIFNHV